MAALDARRIEEARVVADQAAAGEYELGQRLQPAGGDRARAVGDALAALEKGADRRMRLVALEFLVGVEVGIGVAEPDDIADRDQVVFHVIQERAAVGVGVERPAGGMDHQAGLVLLGFDFPQFLEADAIDLRIGAVAQLEALLQLLAEMAAAALGKKRVFGVQFHAALECVGGLAVLADAHVAGGHALDAAVVVIEHFGGGEARGKFPRRGFPPAGRASGTGCRG